MKSHRKSADRNLQAALSVLSLLAISFPILPVGAQTASSPKGVDSYINAQLDTAAEALNNHDARGAIRLATAVLNADCKNARAFFIRGKARAQYDDSKNALIDLSMGLRINPKLADPDVYLVMAQAYLQLNEPQRALHMLEEGNLQKPSLELYKLKASIKILHGHDQEALLDIEKALTFDPYSRTMLLLRGSIYDHNHDYVHAIKEYSRVIEISTKGNLKDSNWMQATKKRADDYEKTGKKELAHTDLETLKKESSSWEKDLFEVAK